MGEATGATAQQGRVGVGEEAGELEDAVEAARVGGGGGKAGQHGLAPDIDDTVSERDPVGGRVRAALRVGLADGRSCGRCLLHATARGRHALGVSGGTKTGVRGGRGGLAHLAEAARGGGSRHRHSAEGGLPPSGLRIRVRFEASAAERATQSRARDGGARRQPQGSAIVGRARGRRLRVLGRALGVVVRGEENEVAPGLHLGRAEARGGHHGVPLVDPGGRSVAGLAEGVGGSSGSKAKLETAVGATGAARCVDVTHLVGATAECHRDLT